MGRGHGKGKRGGRGGGSRRQFVSSLEELEARNAREADWQAGRKPLGEGEEGEEGEGGNDEAGAGTGAEGETKEEGTPAAPAAAAVQGGGGDEESGSEDNDEEAEASVSFPRGGGKGGKAAAPAAAAAAPPPPRKTKGTEGVIETQNPNAVRAAAPKNMKAKDMDMDAPAPQLSRREREALDAERRKAHYDKLHAEGKTDEAKRDLERLALVKARREAATKAKAEAEAAESKGGGKAEASGGSGKVSGDGFERFGAIAIKNMNPTKLKELLKERGCSLQGSKKDLQGRLVEWENDHQA